MGIGIMRVNNLAETGKCTIFALYINDYGEAYDIVQAQDV